MQGGIAGAFESFKESLLSCGSPAVALTADMAGTVLLHMALSVRRDVMVLLAFDRSAGPERLMYSQKLARMLGAATRAVSTQGDVREAALSAASLADADRLFICRETGGGAVDAENPLEGVTDEELAGYIASHGLPEYPAENVPAEPGDDDESEVADKLRSLGYM